MANWNPIITWQNGAISNNAPTGFKIERKTGTGGTYVQIASIASNVFNYTDSIIPDGQTYCYRVKAFNASGDSLPSNEICVVSPGGTTNPPPPPPPPSSGLISLILQVADDWWKIDRVSTKTLSPNGSHDMAFKVTLKGGSKTITRLRLTDGIGGTYDTAGGANVLGAAANSTSPLYNSSLTTINFTVADGGSFLIFAGNDNGAFGNSAAKFTLTATFSDGTSAVGTF